VKSFNPEQNLLLVQLDQGNLKCFASRVFDVSVWKLYLEFENFKRIEKQIQWVNDKASSQIFYLLIDFYETCKIVLPRSWLEVKILQSMNKQIDNNLPKKIEE